MELFIGLVVAAVVVYFIFFRKKEEVSAPTSVTVEEVVAKAEVIDVTPQVTPIAKKKPTVKKATSKPAPKASAKKKAPAKK